MTLDKVSYILISFYFNGIVKSDERELDRFDMLEYSKLAYANVMVKKWEFYKKAGFGNEYYFFTGALLRKEFPLGDVTASGRRTIDMSNTPVIRLPKNMHIFNVTPINEAGCNCKSVTQVAPAEEKFYQGAEFADFPFFNSVGSNLDCYNFPNCIKKVEVEAVFDDVNADIPNDIAADVCVFVLRDIFKVKQITIDKIDDGNPNPMFQEIKNKLNVSAPQ